VEVAAKITQAAERLAELLYAVLRTRRKPTRSVLTICWKSGKE
jgi:hypothetical protein